MASSLHSKCNLLWLLAYVATLVGIVFLVLHFRESTLREMATPAAQADWQAWRESKPNQQDVPGPVARRPPKATEPPALLLMRDHFAVVMSGAVLFGSLLFAAIMMAARGSLSSRPAMTDDDPL